MTRNEWIAEYENFVEEFRFIPLTDETRAAIGSFLDFQLNRMDNAKAALDRIERALGQGDKVGKSAPEPITIETGTKMGEGC